ncbi:hypothetical protein KAR91_07585 [Candidatus Pacearchaeota archaeon]|nr:hypothetical protein [Candidatus Pacearchaeota archaeon]
MDEAIKKILVKVREDRKPQYRHIGYRKGLRVVAYERHSHHPIDKIIEAEKKKRRWIRRWRHLWRSNHNGEWSIFPGL